MKLDQHNHTICRDCIFALYKKNTQYGCYLNRIEKFRNNGAEIIEAVDEDGKEFFTINKRKCHVYRNKQWKKVQKKFDLKKLSNIALDENKLTCDVVIYYNFKNNTIEELTKTIKSVANQKLLPHQIYIINHNFNVEKKQILSDIWNILKQNLFSKCKYYVNIITNEDANYLNCLDIVIKRLPNWHTYFISMKSGYEMPHCMLSDLNHQLHHELIQCVLTLPDENDNFIFSQIPFYKSLSGNKYGTFKDLAQKHIQKFQCEHLIHPIKKMCPNCQW